MKTRHSTPSRTAALLAALAIACLPVPSLAYQAEGASAPAASASSTNDGTDYIAAWTVMGDICQDKYPQMKAAVEEFWTKRWNKETRERVAQMKKSADFHSKVAKHRKNLNERKDEILDQCGRLFMGGAH